MRLTDWLPRVLCINLENRHDRLLSSVKAVHSLDPLMPVERIEAVRDYSDPRRGCAQSHRLALDRAQHLSLPRVLIVEDDVVFSDTAAAKLSSALQAIPATWDILLLGAYYTKTPSTCDPWIKMSYFQGAHAIIYNQRAIGRILARPSIIVSYDEYLAALVTKSVLSCYLINPTLATQRPGFSDIKSMWFDPNAFSPELFSDQHTQQKIYEELADGETASAKSLINCISDRRIVNAMNLLIENWGDI